MRDLTEKEEAKILNLLEENDMEFLREAPEKEEEEVDLNKIDIIRSRGKEFRVNKEDLVKLVNSFLKYKRQKDNIRQDREFIENLPEGRMYKFTIFKYSRTAFYDGNGYGHCDDHLYKGGFNGSNYVSRTIHWGKAYLKDIYKFQITPL